MDDDINEMRHSIVMMAEELAELKKELAAAAEIAGMAQASLFVLRRLSHFTVLGQTVDPAFWDRLIEEKIAALEAIYPEPSPTIVRYLWTLRELLIGNWEDPEPERSPIFTKSRPEFARIWTV